MKKTILFIYILYFISPNYLYALDQESLWNAQFSKIQMLIKEQKNESDAEAETLIDAIINQDVDKGSKYKAMLYLVVLLTNTQDRFAEKYKDERYKRAEKLLEEIIQHDNSNQYKYIAMLDYANMHRQGQTILSINNKINGFSEAEKVLKLLYEQHEYKPIKDDALKILIKMNLNRESEKARHNHIAGLKEAEHLIQLLSAFNKYEALCLRGLLHITGQSELYRGNAEKAMIEGKRILTLVANQNEDQVYKKMAQYNLDHLDDVKAQKR